MVKRSAFVDSVLHVTSINNEKVTFVEREKIIICFILKKFICLSVIILKKTSDNYQVSVFIKIQFFTDLVFMFLSEDVN